MSLRQVLLIIVTLIVVSALLSSKSTSASDWQDLFQKDTVGYLGKAQQIVRAHIVANSLARYESERQAVAANDSVQWRERWCIDAGLMLGDSICYPSLDSLIVIAVVETGFYQYNDNTGLIKSNSWSPDPTWFVGFIGNSRSYFLNSENEGLWGPELDALLTYLSSQPRTDSFLSELTHLFYVLSTWDETLFTFPIRRPVNDFDEVRDFYRYYDSVYLSIEQTEDGDSATDWEGEEADEEFPQFLADTGLVSVQQMIRPPTVEEMSEGYQVTIFVVSEYDYSVEKVVARISNQLEFSLVSRERII